MALAWGRFVPNSKGMNGSRALLLCLLLPLAGCGPVAAPTPPADKGNKGLALPPGHPALPGLARAPAGDHPPALSFDGEGMQLVDPAHGQVRAVLFGTRSDALGRALESTRGPAVRGVRADCAFGPLATWSWPDGLTIFAQDGRFAGWQLEAGSRFAAKPEPATAKGKQAPEKAKRAATTARLSTAQGIAVGSGWGEVRKAYDTKAQQTDLGLEFNAAGLSGLLDQPGEKGRVTLLWSGLTCVGAA